MANKSEFEHGYDYGLYLGQKQFPGKFDLYIVDQDTGEIFEFKNINYKPIFTNIISHENCDKCNNELAYIGNTINHSELYICTNQNCSLFRVAICCK